MRFKERNDLANRCKEWIEDQQNNITAPLDNVHMVLAYLDVKGYLNKVVRCEDCRYWDNRFDVMVCNLTDGMKGASDYCSYGERREDDEIH